MGLTKAETSILLLDDLQITELNEKYLNRNRSTDVIAFPMHDNAFPQVQPQLLGDVVISVETASRQAVEGRCSLYAEMTALLIHAILHLLGYDHAASDEQDRKMTAKEEEILKILTENKKIFP